MSVRRGAWIVQCIDLVLKHWGHKRVWRVTRVQKGKLKGSCRSHFWIRSYSFASQGHSVFPSHIPLGSVFRWTCTKCRSTISRLAIIDSIETDVCTIYLCNRTRDACTFILDLAKAWCDHELIQIKSNCCVCEFIRWRIRLGCRGQHWLKTWIDNNYIYRELLSHCGFFSWRS